MRGETNMKPMKLTSLVVMLLVGFSAAAQGGVFDDVYFSSSKEKKKKTEEKVIQPKKKMQRESSSAIVLASASIHIRRLIKIENVDEYNRRYTSVDVEEPPMMRTWMKRTVLISKSYLITIRK